ncbi:MAG TPA: MmgE/PrpD family protein [Xanthobacteraceae bacterium]|jgi:2-methylcitrate dehydratase PrpD
MNNKNRPNALHRRQLLEAGAGALAAVATLDAPAPLLAQQSGAAATNAAGRTLSDRLADFVAGFDLKRAPPEAIDRARAAFIDTIGVMLAGSREEVSRLACDMVRAEGAAAAATVVGQSFRTSAQLAALANGVAAHAMDYDFTYLSGQSVSPVIPAILPIAETTGALPAECLAAFIVGAGVAARLIRASPRISNDGGWHTTGVVGAIAAAAACARLMKLSPAETANAIGISASLASGIAVNYGTMTKPLHSGNAARSGVLAASLASRGFTAQRTALEGAAGFFDTFDRGLDRSYAPFDDLGRRFDLVTIGYSIKAYPCGGRGHTAIEAALALREKIGARLAEISAIECYLSRSSAQRVNSRYPDTIEAAKFSAAYVVAYSLVHGAPRIPAFTEQALKDERVKALAKLVTASADPALSDALGESPARLKIVLKDGQTFEEQRDYATGSAKVPMTEAQLEEKFNDCAAQAMAPEPAKNILAILNTLADRRSLSDLWPLLRS